MVRFVSNIKLDVFFRETIALNIILLYKNKKVFIQAINTTYYSSCHFMLDIIINVNFLIKLLLKIILLICNPIEKEMDLNLRTFILKDLFQLTIKHYFNNI